MSVYQGRTTTSHETHETHEMRRNMTHHSTDVCFLHCFPRIRVAARIRLLPHGHWPEEPNLAPLRHIEWDRGYNMLPVQHSSTSYGFENNIPTLYHICSGYFGIISM